MHLLAVVLAAKPWDTTAIAMNAWRVHDTRVHKPRKLALWGASAGDQPASRKACVGRGFPGLDSDLLGGTMGV